MDDIYFTEKTIQMLYCITVIISDTTFFIRSILFVRPHRSFSSPKYCILIIRCRLYFFDFTVFYGCEEYRDQLKNTILSQILFISKIYTIRLSPMTIKSILCDNIIIPLDITFYYDGYNIYYDS